jgi:CYTH domain-containing protein
LGVWVYPARRGPASAADRLTSVLNYSAPPGKELKYARRELERRFLFTELPDEEVVRVARIVDRYLPGTRIRLRQTIEVAGDGEVERTLYKLTQKVAAPSEGPGLITTMYLNAAEYALLAELPAAWLRKTRLSIPPLGVDVFEDALAGLVLGEAEFTDEQSMRSYAAPPSAIAEVTHDQRLTGGRLVATSSRELSAALAEYGLANSLRHSSEPT